MIFEYAMDQLLKNRTPTKIILEKRRANTGRLLRAGHCSKHVIRVLQLLLTTPHVKEKLPSPFYRGRNQGRDRRNFSKAMKMVRSGAGLLSPGACPRSVGLRTGLGPGRTLVSPGEL